MYSHPREKREEEEAIFQFNYLFFSLQGGKAASDLWETIFGGCILPFPHFLLAFLWHKKVFIPPGQEALHFPPGRIDKEPLFPILKRKRKKVP